MQQLPHAPLFLPDAELSRLAQSAAEHAAANANAPHGNAHATTTPRGFKAQRARAPSPPPSPPPSLQRVWNPPHCRTSSAPHRPTMTTSASTSAPARPRCEPTTSQVSSPLRRARPQTSAPSSACGPRDPHLPRPPQIKPLKTTATATSTCPSAPSDSSQSGSHREVRWKTLSGVTPYLSLLSLEENRKQVGFRRVVARPRGASRVDIYTTRTSHTLPPLSRKPIGSRHRIYINIYV